MARLALSLTLLFVLAATAGAQRHFLVSPQEEVIPLRAGDAAGGIIRERQGARHPESAAGCSDIGPYYGGNPWMFTGTWPAYHNDVMGQWYVAPATGTIDTIFFNVGNVGSVCGHDSLVFVRVHRSNINLSYGPGVRPGPFYPPCQLWGYWQNTNDLDQGITAFPANATDTTWISTYSLPGAYSLPVPASTPPIGEELWGAGGFNFYARANSVNAVVMADLGPLQVEAGDVFFISIQVNWNGGPFHCDPEEFDPGEEPMAFYYSEQTVSTSDEFYPSRNWKFYEHEKGPATCAGLPLDSMKRGWYARGTGVDSLDAILWDFWYSMTVTENAGPTVFSQDELGSTLNTGPRTLDAEIADCYSGNPLLSGVASASIRFEVDGVEQPPVTMNDVGADVWQGSVPGQTPGTRVTGRIEATDLEGLKSNGPSFAYMVVPFGNSWFRIDTGYACVEHDLGSSGTTLDTASFFLPPTASAGADPRDNGTSGPYDMGGDFTLFGDQFRYAWIGVNGGLALSKTATETLDVNSNGRFLASGETPWTFPAPQNHERGNPSQAGRMPPMFIAPFWADHLLGDESGQYGRISVGDAGDTCLFIAEWDSIGIDLGGIQVHGTPSFRAVLNRCTGTVEFQYETVGDYFPSGYYYHSLTGLQADSNALTGPNPGYVLLSDDGFPAEIAPADGRCVRMIPTVGMVVADGWTLVSLFVRPLDGDYSVGHLFPGYEGRFWAFLNPGGFMLADSLRPGRGYWIKDPPAMGSVPGELIHDISVPVNDKWNLIGGPAGFLATGSIAVTGGVITSPFYSYNNAYYWGVVLQPGQGYWVKMIGAGTLSMNSWTIPAIPQPASSPEGTPTDAGRIVVRDAAGRSQTLYLSEGTDERGGTVDPTIYDLPPLPPVEIFDVRFASGRMLEVIGGTGRVGAEPGSSNPELAIAVRGARYPVSVEWDLPAPLTAAGLTIASAGTDKAAATSMAGSGTLTFDAIASGLLSIRFDGGSSVPSEFALSANYPNPFNPTTTFTVDLPLPTDLRVEVVDILGRSTAELMNGPQPAGSHRLTWDGLDRNGVAAPSGVYIIRLSSANYNASRKALLVR